MLNRLIGRNLIIMKSKPFEIKYCAYSNAHYTKGGAAHANISTKPRLITCHRPFSAGIKGGL